MSAFVYKPILSKLQKAYEAHVRDLCEMYRIRRSQFTSKMQIDTKRLYTREDMEALYDANEWLEYTCCFQSCCAWCHEPRWDDSADDNEHDECDLRMYYMSEPGIAEQEKTLIELKPELPTVVVACIMSFI